jgi:hypothetical protein
MICPSRRNHERTKDTCCRGITAACAFSDELRKPSGWFRQSRESPGGGGPEGGGPEGGGPGSQFRLNPAVGRRISEQSSSTEKVSYQLPVNKGVQAPRQMYIEKW